MVKCVAAIPIDIARIVTHIAKDFVVNPIHRVCHPGVSRPMTFCLKGYDDHAFEFKEHLPPMYASLFASCTLEPRLR
jgi:hypothetical protein